MNFNRDQRIIEAKHQHQHQHQQQHQQQQQQQQQNISKKQQIQQIIINKTNSNIKYWTDIIVDPRSKKFIKDFENIYNIMYSVEMINGSGDIRKFIDSVSTELTRLTIKNLVNELQELKQFQIMYSGLEEFLEKEDLYEENEYTQQINKKPFDYLPDLIPTYPGVPLEGTPELPEYNNNNNNNNDNDNEKFTVDLYSKLNIKSNKNPYDYIFTTELEDVSNIKINTFEHNIINNGYEIDIDSNKFNINEMLIDIPTKNYLTIHDLLIEINTCIQKRLGGNICIEFDKTLNKNKFYSKSKISNMENTIDFSISELGKILGYCEDKYIIKDFLIAEKNHRFPNITDMLKLSVYINGTNAICKDKQINILDKITNINNILKASEFNMIVFEKIEYITVKILDSNGQLYNFGNNEFNINFEYTYKNNN